MVYSPVPLPAGPRTGQRRGAFYRGVLGTPGTHLDGHAARLGELQQVVAQVLHPLDVEPDVGGAVQGLDQGPGAVVHAHSGDDLGPAHGDKRSHVSRGGPRIRSMKSPGVVNESSIGISRRILSIMSLNFIIVDQIIGLIPIEDSVDNQPQKWN